jgi:hypothetical protein
MSALRSNSKASLVASVAIGLTFYEGIGVLIRAAVMPLQTLATFLINFLLVRGWRNVMLLGEPAYSLADVAFTAFAGLLLLAIGLGVGMVLVKPTASRTKRGR